MTTDKQFKRSVRERAARTGESYTAARQQLRPAMESERGVFRLAVGQSTECNDPSDSDALRRSGDELRSLLRAAAADGARLLHTCEGALVTPHKRLVSSLAPDKVGPADWTRTQWTVLREELAATAALAGELGIWAVVGSIHPLTPPTRPHNSLYVISDAGVVHTRYDERFLSNTKVSFMYTPGADPVTFEVDGVRFGCALGMESHFPEVFAEYERLDVDCVLFSTTAPAKTGAISSFALECQGHASAVSTWVSYAAGIGDGASPSGVAGFDGAWIGQCEECGPVVVTVDIDLDAENPARPWRRRARSGIYADRLATQDPRSIDRTAI